MIPRRGINGEISDYKNEVNERRQKRREQIKQRKQKLAAMEPDERCDFEMKYFIGKWCFELRRNSKGQIGYFEAIARATRRFSDVYIGDILEAYPAEEESAMYEQAIRHELRSQTLERTVHDLLLNRYECSHCGEDFEQLPNAALCPHCGKRCGPEECVEDFGDFDKYEFTHEDLEAAKKKMFEKTYPDYKEKWVGKTPEEIEAQMEGFSRDSEEYRKLGLRLRDAKLVKQYLFPMFVTWQQYRFLPERYTQSRRQSVSDSR